MKDEIYLRYEVYQLLLAEGHSPEQADQILNEVNWSKLKSYGKSLGAAAAIGGAGYLGGTGVKMLGGNSGQQPEAEPQAMSQQAAASTQQSADSTQQASKYGTYHGHKVHYAGKATEKGREITMFVVGVKEKSNIGLKQAKLVARAGVGSLVTGQQNYSTNMTGVFVSVKNVKGYGLVAIAKHDPVAGQQMQDMMSGKSGGSYNSGASQSGHTSDHIDDF